MSGTEKKFHFAVKSIGTAALYLFSASIFLSISGANIAIGAMLIAFMLDFHSWWPVLKNDRIFQFSLCFFSLLALRTLWAAWEFPSLTGRHLDGFWDWFYLSFSIPVAWWFHGRSNRSYAALYLAILSLLAHMLYRTDFVQLEAILRGARSGLGMQIPLTGLFTCTVLLAVILLGPRIWGSSEKYFLFFSRFFLWLFLTLVFLKALIVTQSITSWVAGAIVIPPMLWIALRRHFSLQKKTMLTAGIAVIIVGIVFIGFLLHRNAGTIGKRLSSQKKVIETMGSLDFEDIPFTAGIGVRIWTYRYGIQKWIERPLLGWGTGVEVAKLPGTPEKSLAHMHSTYLEILNRFGLVGMIFFITGAWLFLKSVKKAYLNHFIPLDLFLIFVGSFTIVLIWCAANFRMATYFRCYCIFFTSMGYSFCLHLNQSNKRRNSRKRSIGKTETKDVYAPTHLHHIDDIEQNIIS